MSYFTINRVVLVGRLTREPELRALPSGAGGCGCIASPAVAAWAGAAVCTSTLTGTGTGPKATTPFGSIGVGWLGGTCRPAIHVPLVEPWSTTIMRSSITVAC